MIVAKFQLMRHLYGARWDGAALYHLFPIFITLILHPIIAPIDFFGFYHVHLYILTQVAHWTVCNRHEMKMFYQSLSLSKKYDYGAFILWLIYLYVQAQIVFTISAIYFKFDFSEIYNYRKLVIFFLAPLQGMALGMLINTRQIIPLLYLLLFPIYYKVTFYELTDMAWPNPFYGIYFFIASGGWINLLQILGHAFFALLIIQWQRKKTGSQIP